MMGQTIARGAWPGSRLRVVIPPAAYDGCFRRRCLWKGPFGAGGPSRYPRCAQNVRSGPFRRGRRRRTGGGLRVSGQSAHAGDRNRSGCKGARDGPRQGSISSHECCSLTARSSAPDWPPPAVSDCSARGIGSARRQSHSGGAPPDHRVALVLPLLLNGQLFGFKCSLTSPCGRRTESIESCDIEHPSQLCPTATHVIEVG
jgi:hypothetical protein